YAPDTLTIVKGSPQIRRRFIDMEIRQIQPTYNYHLNQYQKILKQRHHLLKQIQKRDVQDKTMLHVLTEQLAQHAASLLERRFVFLELIRKWARPIHHSISHERDELNIYYTTTIDVSEEAAEETIFDAYLAKCQEV